MIPDYSKENVVLIFPSQGAISISELVKKTKYEDLSSSNEDTLLFPKGLHPGTLLKTSKATDTWDLEISKTCKLPITKAIFIDSTWNQSKGIYKDPNLNKIPCIVIQNRISQFWRHQKGSPRWYLATVEAIHQFLVELHLHLWGLHPQYKGIYNCFTESCIKQFSCGLYRDDERSYIGQYDDLLFFFKHMYDLIHAYYDHDNLHAYKRRLL